MKMVFKILLVMAIMVFLPPMGANAAKGCTYFKGGVKMTAGNNTKKTFSDGINVCKNGEWIVLSSRKSARSLSCQDGMVLAYCKITWSDGSRSALPWGVGQRQGGVVDAIIYYDLQWNPSCILLYADGSILTSYDTGKCY